VSLVGRRYYLIVPESLEADENGIATGRPSFAFRQILDQVLQLSRPEDWVYLAPANTFGGATTEEVAAFNYLKVHNPSFVIWCPGVTLPAIINRPEYVDTWHNAVLLSQIIDLRGMIFELVTTSLHAPRAEWCFSRAGFNLAKVHAFSYEVKDSRVMRRNIYYRYPKLHYLYEKLAFLRDRIKYRAARVV